MFPLNSNSNIMLSYANSTIFITTDSPQNWDRGTILIYLCLLFAREILMTFITSLLTPLILRLFENYKHFISQDFLLFFIEYFLLVLSEVTFLTVLSKLSQFFIIIMLSFFIYFLYYTYYFPYSLDMADLIHMPINESRRSFITKCKGMVNFVTTIAILAVDFNIFPTFMGKTDRFGYSLMDTGVGLYIFINGLTSNEVKLNYKRNFYKSNIQMLQNTMPLIVIGVFRAFSVHLLNYPVNVHEYGKHWNFFLTLAVVRLLGTFLLTFIHPKYALHLSFISILFYELILHWGIQEWLLADIPRNNFITANREGIISSFGYIALYLAVIGYSRYLLQFKNETLLKNFIQLFKITSISILLWTVTFLTKDFLLCSRRMANFGYCIWIISLGSYFLSALLFIELILIIINQSFNQQKKTHSHVMTILTPIIYESINYNGLAYFLVANLLTGFINMSMNTRNCDILTSLFILYCYMFVNCLIAFGLYKKKIQLKF